MSHDRDDDLTDSSEVDRKKTSQSDRKRVIGEGMTSPDSTQVPLKAETGEPDLDAIKGRILPDQDDDANDRSSNR